MLGFFLVFSSYFSPNRRLSSITEQIPSPVRTSLVWGQKRHKLLAGLRSARGHRTDSTNSLQSRMEWQGVKDFILSLKHCSPDFFSFSLKCILRNTFFTLQPSKHDTCNWNKTKHYLTVLHVIHWYSLVYFISCFLLLTLVLIYLLFSWPTNGSQLTVEKMSP